MKELISIINNFDCERYVKNPIVRSMLKAALIICFQYYVLKPSKLINVAKKVGWVMMYSTLYSRYTCRISQSSGDVSLSKKETCIKKMIDARYPNDVEYVYALPIYKDKVGDDRISLKYIPLIHGDLEKILDDEAESEVSNSSSQETTRYFKWNGTRNRYDAMHPSKLFPSKNYLALSDIVVKNIATSKILESFSTFAISICGEPGLGKSKFSEFIATTTSGDDKVHTVYRVDLSETACMKIPPETLFESIFFSIAILHPTVFVIDELDKCIHEYIRYVFKDAEDTKKHMAKTEDQNLIPTLDFEVDNREERFKEHARDVTIKYLYTILSVLERAGNKASCIVIFSTNNFDTIFSHLPEEDMIHFRSFRDRFAGVTFERCDRNEIIKYLKHYNDVFVGSPFFVPLDEMDRILDDLHPDITVTYRVLTQISTLSSMNPRLIVNSLNNLQISTSSSSIHYSPIPIGSCGGIVKRANEVKKESEDDELEEDSEDDEDDLCVCDCVRGEDWGKCICNCHSRRVYRPYVCKECNASNSCCAVEQLESCGCNCHPPEDNGIIKCLPHECYGCKRACDDIDGNGCMCYCHKNTRRDTEVDPPVIIDTTSYSKDEVEEVLYPEKYPMHSKRHPNDVVVSEEDLRLFDDAIVRIGCMWCGNIYLGRCTCAVCAPHSSSFVTTGRYTFNLDASSSAILVEEIEMCHFCRHSEEFGTPARIPSNDLVQLKRRESIHMAEVRRLMFEQQAMTSSEEKIRGVVALFEYLSRPETVKDLFYLSSFKYTVLKRICSLLYTESKSTSAGKTLWTDSNGVFSAILEGYRLTAFDRNNLNE